MYTHDDNADIDSWYYSEHTYNYRNNMDLVAIIIIPTINDYYYYSMRVIIIIVLLLKV